MSPLNKSDEHYKKEIVSLLERPISDLNLNDIRQHIDYIDSQMSELIQLRILLAKKVGELKKVQGDKGDNLILRPGREALILRKWITQLQKDVPAEAVLSIWRAIISVCCLEEQAICGWVSEEGQSEDEFNHYFGRFFPKQRVGTALDVLRQLCTQKYGIGLINHSEWTDSLVEALIEAAHVYGIRVFLGLPFVGESTFKTVACAYIQVEESGDDQSLIALHIPESSQKNLVKDTLNKASLPFEIDWEGESYLLLRYSGFVSSGEDGVLLELQQVLDDFSVVVTYLGAYASPIQLK